MEKETEHPVPEGSFKTLLLVGEDPQLLTEEIPFLENHGYRVVRTGAEAQAEAQVRRGVPDLVLVDLEPGRESDGTWTAWRLLQESPTALLFRVDPHGAPEVLERAEAVNPCGYVRRGDGAAMLLVSLRLLRRPPLSLDTSTGSLLLFRPRLTARSRLLPGM